MLSMLTRRLCPLMSLALAFGCGKKINDPKSTDVNRTSQNQELPAVLTLQLNASESPQTSYKLPRNAWFKLPATLRAANGNPVGARVKIFYNLASDGSYEFHCYYQGVNAVQLDFERCESQDNIEIISNSEDLESMDFPMDKETWVRMQLTDGSASSLHIDSIYLVDWK